MSGSHPSSVRPDIFMKTVSAAYAKANLPELLKEVDKGKTIAISRYKNRSPCFHPLQRQKSRSGNTEHSE